MKRPLVLNGPPPDPDDMPLPRGKRVRLVALEPAPLMRLAAVGALEEVLAGVESLAVLDLVRLAAPLELLCWLNDRDDRVGTVRTIEGDGYWAALELLDRCCLPDGGAPRRPVGSAFHFAVMDSAEAADGAWLLADDRRLRWLVRSAAPEVGLVRSATVAMAYADVP